MTPEVTRLWVPPGAWLATMRAWRADGYVMFDWLTAVDENDRADRPGFDVVCQLIRLPTGEVGLGRLLARTTVPDGAELASLTTLWPGAAWHERETFEMFGIDFAGFADDSGCGLRPLLLAPSDEDVPARPLRKDVGLAPRDQPPARG